MNEETTGGKYDGGREQAKDQLETCLELMAAWETTIDEDPSTRESAEQDIYDDVLSVLVRGGWHSPGEATSAIDGEYEYELLLCAGGPAVRIRGELERFNEPDTIKLEFQDWGIPWTDYRLNSDERAGLLTFARRFYYGIA